MSEETEPQVMILGTYHMANPGLDLVKTSIRDTLGAERQAEIEAVVARLAEFAPTQICVEATVESASIGERYVAYRSGGIGLSANEIEQIGFRLAERLGHERLYPVDYQLDWDGQRLFTFAEAHGNDAWLTRANHLISTIGPMMEEWDRCYSVGEILAIHNSEAMIALSQSLYADAVEVTDGLEFPGVETTAAWFTRNLRIWANIRRCIDSDSDRVLVLYGAGHLKYLRDFVRETTGVLEVPASGFLPPAPAEALRNASVLRL